MTVWAAYPFRAASVACLLAGALTLGGCSKEAALRDRLGAFFALGDTLYYQQELRCRAAVFRATDNAVGEALLVHADPYEAQAAYRQTGLGAVQNAAVPPRDLAEVMLLSGDGALGKQALAAAALVGDCLDEATSRRIRLALQEKGNLLGYDAELGGAFLLDRSTRTVIFFAGEPV
jgi:hypothetical protein